ncbi:MAG: rRNA maturation RNase YbeY [Ruminococcaceae bacterium]|nr:rRNA maturation RNase YbeY [Oscillospiraceae bacterium]
MRHYIHFTNEQDMEAVTSELRCLVKAAIYASLAYEDFRRSAEISVTFTDNEGIREINREHRDIDSATDVLSFPMLGDDEFDDVNHGTGAVLLGDIVISLERAREQAAEFGHSYTREVAFLTVHSVLHLLGYDHVNSEEEEHEMRVRQHAILDYMGISR